MPKKLPTPPFPKEKIMEIRRRKGTDKLKQSPNKMSAEERNTIRQHQVEVNEIRKKRRKEIQRQRAGMLTRMRRKGSGGGGVSPATLLGRQGKLFNPAKKF